MSHRNMFGYYLESISKAFEYEPNDTMDRLKLLSEVADTDKALDTDDYIFVHNCINNALELAFSQLIRK